MNTRSSNPLPMRSGNPVLTAGTFAAKAERGAGAMTLEGTVNKTALSLLILFATAAWTWSLGSVDALTGQGNPAAAAPWTMVGVVGGFIVAMTTIFKKEWSPVTAPAYAALEGLALGGISVVFEQRFPGIVAQAVFLTFGTLGGLLLAYRSGLIRATENFRLAVFAATAGIALVYLASFVMGFFGSSIPMIHSGGTMGIVFSLFVVGVAAMNLVLDFDFIEQGAERGAPKYMEWYASFGLMVTLVWLYMEILRLLSKMQERR